MDIPTSSEAEERLIWRDHLALHISWLYFIFSITCDTAVSKVETD
jgi:hypothetical protein